MTNAPDNLSQQRAQIRIALGGFAMLAFASTGVIARADKSPGSPRVSRWETDSDRSPPPRQRPWPPPLVRLDASSRAPPPLERGPSALRSP